MSQYSNTRAGWESDGSPELQLILPKLVDTASKNLNITCTSATRLTRGSWHEIYALQFEQGETAFESLSRAGFECIARVARVQGNTAKEESEIATLRHLKKHAKIPVPEVYYYDLSHENDIGASLVLMEKMPGHHLYTIWDGLSLEHKKAALSEVASVIAQFSSIQLDQIGCLTDGGIGPVLSPCYESPQGPFTSTEDYLDSFVSGLEAHLPKEDSTSSEIRKTISTFLTEQSTRKCLQAPFSLIHPDLDAENMLFTEALDGSGPKLTGVIDFEYAYIGPRYFLYEYPIFIQDAASSEDLHQENAVLREHFVSQIAYELQTPEACDTLIQCMDLKGGILDSFRDCFMESKYSDEMVDTAREYLETAKNGQGRASPGREDYGPEPCSEKSDLLSVASLQQALMIVNPS
ncbi:hypothetical protein GQ53DRAFT_881175 [Thozetella sp. PMI_491]|nr:hypothetical protein GQ53DRAFT_881175 [Thozetella sp. PMI_491]